MAAHFRSCRLRLALLGFCAASTLFSATLLPAAEPKSNDREQTQLRRLQQTVRKLEQEKAQLEEEKSQLEQQKSQLDAQLQQAGERLDERHRDQQALTERTAVLERELAQSRSQNASLTQSVAETQQALQHSTTAARQLDETLATQRAAFSACAARNDKLHGYGVELLERYEKKSCSDALLQADPFTQLKRAEIESLKEEYRDKLDEQKLNTAAPGEQGVTATP